MRSQTILVIASIGVERIAPGTPHIQYQNITKLYGETKKRLTQNKVERIRLQA